MDHEVKRQGCGSDLLLVALYLRGISFHPSLTCHTGEVIGLLMAIYQQPSFLP